ncbi:MAG: 1-acyl-sn-glycerol-3-phosphate acyltransferase [Lactobacillaceae bacterium]|jgi:1-acyl-sn-glycerol-3-phosphate acyltransferase|nr:1-acyl-sn-glycerol-3-phosphate acyltransferase [Lactobacillaceae bacterium]
MYTFIIYLVKFLIKIITGGIDVRNKQNLPQDDNYILAGPHRAWWDPVFYAVVSLPKRFIFMAKKENFKFKPFGWFISKLGAFPVDRENPGPSAIKIPVKELKSGNRSLIIFPSGSRHSSELLNGAALIARLSGKPIVPMVYQGPVVLKGLFKRHSAVINIGKPITVDRKDTEDEITAKLQTALEQLDKETNPEWKYVDPHPKQRNKKKS